MEQKVDFEDLLKTISAGKEKAELDGKIDYFRLRKEWSVLLKKLLTMLVVFQMAITILVGFGVLNFLNYQWFINIIVTETFLQIVGMCVLVVAFLYPKEKNTEEVQVIRKTGS